MPRIIFIVTDAQDRKLKRMAFDRRISLANLIREALGLPHVQRGEQAKSPKRHFLDGDL